MSRKSLESWPRNQEPRPVDTQAYRSQARISEQSLIGACNIGVQTEVRIESFAKLLREGGSIVRERNPAHMGRRLGKNGNGDSDCRSGDIINPWVIRDGPDNRGAIIVCGFDYGSILSVND